MVACSKMKKPRKIFDASKARTKGTELEQYALKKQTGGATDMGGKGGKVMIYISLCCDRSVKTTR
jgi:hypothetical protein